MHPLKPGKLQAGVFGKPKSPPEAHTQHTKFGMGNYYGRASKNPQGRVRDATVGFRSVTKKQLGTKPKSVV